MGFAGWIMEQQTAPMLAHHTASKPKPRRLWLRLERGGPPAIRQSPKVNRIQPKEYSIASSHSMARSPFDVPNQVAPPPKHVESENLERPAKNAIIPIRGNFPGGNEC